jgi:hypothetical protein
VSLIQHGQGNASPVKRQGQQGVSGLDAQLHLLVGGSGDRRDAERDQAIEPVLTVRYIPGAREQAESWC